MEPEIALNVTEPLRMLFPVNVLFAESVGMPVIAPAAPLTESTPVLLTVEPEIPIPVPATSEAMTLQPEVVALPLESLQRTAPADPEFAPAICGLEVEP